MSDVIGLPTPYAAARVAAFLAEHQRSGTSATASGASQSHDPDSRLYAVSRDADTVIRYMAANS